MTPYIFTSCSGLVVMGSERAWGLAGMTRRGFIAVSNMRADLMMEGRTEIARFDVEVDRALETRIRIAYKISTLLQ